MAVLLVTLVGIENSCSREKEKLNLDDTLLAAASFGHLFYIFVAENFFLVKE